MKQKTNFPFPVPDYRFDQRNEMFKRRTWDEEFIELGNRLYTQVKHDDYKPFGVEKFCVTCKKCADHCPSKSISHDAPTNEGPSISNFSGVKKWYINPEKCFKFWVKNWMDCNNCVSVCPFNKLSGILHNSVRYFIRTMPALNRLMILMDDLLGYGKPISVCDKDFWET